MSMIQEMLSGEVDSGGAVLSMLQEKRRGQHDSGDAACCA
jgi:hypothetical protein